MEEWLVREVFLEKEDLVWFLKHVQELARWRWAHVSRSRGCSGDWIHMGHHQLHAGNISWHPTSCLCRRPLAFHSGLPWWQRVWEVVEPHSAYTNTPLQGQGSCTLWSGPSTWEKSWWMCFYPFLPRQQDPEASFQWLLRGALWGQAVRCTPRAAPLRGTPVPRFTPHVSHFCSVELPSLTKEKYRGLHLSDSAFWRTSCFLKSHFPVHLQHTLIPLSVTSVKKTRCTTAIHVRTPLPPQDAFPEADCNFCKDLEAQDFFRKPFNHIFQFRSRWSHVGT